MPIDLLMKVKASTLVEVEWNHRKNEKVYQVGLYLVCILHITFLNTQANEPIERFFYFKNFDNCFDG